MLSTTIFLTTLFSTIFAAPLTQPNYIVVEPRSFFSCQPNFTEPHTTAISPSVDLDQSWFIFENADRQITNVTLRNAHDVYEGINYNNNFVISRTDSSSLNFRLTSEVVNGVQEYIAAFNETSLGSSIADQDVTVWRARCATCNTSLYGNGSKCQIISTAYSTKCVTLLNEEGLIGLEECVAFEDVVESKEVGNQAWDIL